MMRTCHAVGVRLRRRSPYRAAVQVCAHLPIHAARDVVGVRGPRELRLGDLVLGEDQEDGAVEGLHALAHHQLRHREQRGRRGRIGPDECIDVGQLREHAKEQAQEHDPREQLEGHGGANDDERVLYLKACGNTGFLFFFTCIC